ncbi:hypothetical protein BPOR_0103g00150 [Botrytis porri]|uniref:Uncharacterized protein n=1 Tax=Botrytis porri TaxID=87229 RepID=A0A4Z1KYB2_9HELO|nr:hypothetical protein BPOR_0103g00150 [Botrytis porri]
MAMNGVRDDANRDGILPQLIDFIRHLGKPGKFGSPYPQSVVSREKKAENLPVAGLSIMSERKLAITIIYGVGSLMMDHWATQRVSLSQRMLMNGQDATRSTQPKNSHLLSKMDLGSHCWSLGKRVS